MEVFTPQGLFSAAEQLMPQPIYQQFLRESDYDFLDMIQNLQTTDASTNTTTTNNSTDAATNGTATGDKADADLIIVEGHDPITSPIDPS